MGGRPLELILMAKASKAAKARLKRMSMTDKAKIKKAAAMLADCELITSARYNAILRACKAGY